MNNLATSDYSKFKTLKQNRAVNAAHVARLVASIEKNPHILDAQPILVNENMEIIDGQHRFEACKHLGIPVPYVQVAGLDVADAREMNAIQKNWTAMDYAWSHASTGNVHYKALLKYRSEHPRLSLSVVRAICSSGQGSLGGDESVSQSFRNGNFTVNRDVEEVEWILSQIDVISEIVNYEMPMSTGLVTAVCKAIDTIDEFDMEQLLKNLRKNPQMMHRTSTVRDGLRMIEEIFNHGKHNRIRFY